MFCYLSDPIDLSINPNQIKMGTHLQFLFRVKLNKKVISGEGGGGE